MPGVSIPYHRDFRLNVGLDFKTLAVLRNESSDDTASHFVKNKTTAGYHIIKKISDVCEFFQVPMEYALKVQAGTINNPVVKEWLKDVYDDNCIKVAFRVTFLQKTGMGDFPKEKAKCPDCSHYISSMNLGKELVVMMKLSTSDPSSDTIDEFSHGLGKVLRSSQNALDDSTISDLEIFASKYDLLRHQKKFENISLDICYGSFSQHEVYPASLKGMVATLKEFKQRCAGWEKFFTSNDQVKTAIYQEVLMLKRGDPRIQRANWAGAEDPRHVQPKTLATSASSCISTTAPHRVSLFYIKVSLTPINAEEKRNQIDRQLDLTRLSECCFRSRAAREMLQKFLDKNEFFPQAHQREKELIIGDVDQINSKIDATIRDLNIVANPLQKNIDFDSDRNLLHEVKAFIEKVTSRFPPGYDLDILIVGKTGNGKTSTTNSICGRQEFNVSNSLESTTLTENKIHIKRDGRVVTIIDAPGLCDTRVSYLKNIEAIKKSFIHCPNGIHALVVVLAFGVTMTPEERTVIVKLKRAFGEEVFKDYCVIVFTHGDNFNDTFEGKKTFAEWCREDVDPFTASLIKEANYRCVLINNREKNPGVLKQQVIELIATVDILSPTGNRYTNEWFEKARHEREKIIKEEILPHVNRVVVRDTELVLDSVDQFIRNQSRDKTDLHNIRNDIKELIEKRLRQDADVPQVSRVIKTLDSLLKVIVEKGDSVSSISKQLKETRAALKNAMSADDARVTDMIVKILSYCFPGNSTVVAKPGVVKSIKDLDVGDEVLVREASGRLFFDQVFMFGHKNSDAVAEFVVLHMEGGDQSVSASESHLALCVRNGVEKYLPAKDVNVGDDLLFLSSHHDQSKAALERRRVVSITVEEKQGVFAPFTRSGTIIVDGALMSCYVDVLPHWASHAMLSPLRQLYKLSPSALNFVNGGKNNTEIPPLAKLALKWL